MSIIGAVLIIGQFVLLAAFFGVLALFIWGLAYDAYDNRRRAKAAATEAKPVTVEPPVVKPVSTPALTAEQLVA